LLTRAVLRSCPKAGEVDSGHQPGTPGGNVAEFRRNTSVTLPARGGNDSCFSFLAFGCAQYV
jgi:hypothetical protein